MKNLMLALSATLLLTAGTSSAGIDEVRESLRGMEEGCGEKYSGQFADMDSGQAESFCLAAFSAFCASKWANSQEYRDQYAEVTDQQIREGTRQYDEQRAEYCTLGSSFENFGQRCPYCSQ